MTGVEDSDIYIQSSNEPYPIEPDSQRIQFIYIIMIPSVLKAGFTSAQDAYDKTTKELIDSVNYGTLTNQLNYFANAYGIAVMKFVQANEQPIIGAYTAPDGSTAAGLPIGVIVLLTVAISCICCCCVIRVHFYDYIDPNYRRGNIIVPENRSVHIPMHAMPTAVGYAFMPQQRVEEDDDDDSTVYHTVEGQPIDRKTYRRMMQPNAQQSYPTVRRPYEPTLRNTDYRYGLSPASMWQWVASGGNPSLMK
jgi:hypothetical protein